MNPNYFSDINTKLAARITVEEAKILAVDNVVAVLKDDGLPYMPLQIGCDKVHTKINVLKQILELDNP